MSARILQGDCLQVMADMLAAGEQVDAIVTDPPYELGFMGKGWDATGIANSVELWKLAYMLLKPGGHLLAFSATRTQHRMVCAIEDAGFEVRDRKRYDCSAETKYGAFFDSLNDAQRGVLLEFMNEYGGDGLGSELAWAYGSGFPKSLDVSKAIDKAAGAERERHNRPAFGGTFSDDAGTTYGTAISCDPITPAAQQWAGWGTALKPAWEPICVARKPLSEGTVAANVLEHGTGALNIDGCRVGTTDKLGGGWQSKPDTENMNGGWQRPWMKDDAALTAKQDRANASVAKAEALGRWPANVIHDGSDEVLAAFAQFGEKGGAAPPSQTGSATTANIFGKYNKRSDVHHNDSGTAARFFYSAKASKADRAGSKHPTVKPISLMRYLCKLVTPPGGTVLDPFAGSGTTLQAALDEGFNAVGIEREDEYVADIKRRLGIAEEEDDIDAFLASLVA